MAARPWFAPAALGAAWLLLGMAAGTTGALASGPAGRVPQFLQSTLVGLVWAGLVWPAAGLARTRPWPGRPRARWLALHVTAGTVASFALNLTFFAVLALAGTVAWAGVTGAALTAGIYWLHLNALGFLGTVAAVHLFDLWARSGRAGGAELVDADDPAADALLVPSGGGGTRIPLADIDWIAADGDYARVHAGGRDYLLSERMKTLEARLDGARFVRVHRSAIVNVGRVRELRHRSHGDYEAVLADGTSVRVSRTRREGLLRVFAGGA